jgi:hypothetical protein
MEAKYKYFKISTFSGTLQILASKINSETPSGQESFHSTAIFDSWL